MATGWRHITVKQYMAIKRVQEYVGYSGRERIANLLSIVTKHSIDKLEAMSFSEFDKLAALVSFCNVAPKGRLRRVLWINGTRYVLQDKVQDYNPAAGLSLIHYRNAGVNQNIHNVLAWIYKPTFAKHDPDKAANDFLIVPITKVTASFFLFYRKALLLREGINACRESQMGMLSEHLDQVTKHFQSTGGGITR